MNCLADPGAAIQNVADSLFADAECVRYEPRLEFRRLHSGCILQKLDLKDLDGLLRCE